MESKATASQEDATEVLIEEYQIYKDAQDRRDAQAVEACMSPSCFQIARQNPSWNLGSRAEIMRILTGMGMFTAGLKDRAPGTVTMRALTQDEKDTLPPAEKERATREAWQGLRVVLEDAEPDGRVVEVNYYWRKEEWRWVQCLHDLLWVGPKIATAENDVGDTVFGHRN